MAAGSGLGTRLVQNQGGSVKVTCVRKMADAAALYCVFYLWYGMVWYGYLISPGEAISHEATLQGTQNSTDTSTVE